MRSSVEIQADLEAAYAARRTALQAQSYSLDTGQGRQQVERANLVEINKMIRSLESELDAARGEEAGDNGLLLATFRRY